MKKSNKIVFAVQSALAVMYSFFACNGLKGVSFDFGCCHISYWLMLTCVTLSAFLALDILRRRFWVRGARYFRFFIMFMSVQIFARILIMAYLRNFSFVNTNFWLFDIVQVTLFIYLNSRIRENLEKPSDKKKFYASVVVDQLIIWLSVSLIGFFHVAMHWCLI